MSRLIKILIGPLLFVSCYLFLPPIFTTTAARLAIGTMLWMAFWWVSVPVEYVVTAFLPITINAIFGMVEMKTVISNYSQETILLLLGASVLTVLWSEVGLDRRIAARFLSLVGGNLRTQLVFWFFLSLVLSTILPNVIVCATITPIAVSMLRYVGEEDVSKSKIASIILITIVYATGVGGLASPLGGAMNLVAVDYIEKVIGSEYIYTTWVVKFFPVMLVLILTNLAYLLFVCDKNINLGGSREYFRKQCQAMPKMKKSEKVALVLFLIATILSFTRVFYKDILPGLKPAYVFITCAIVSFLITEKGGKRLIAWKNAEEKIVWELMYVYAGGLALGAIINGSGAAKDIGLAIEKTNLQGGFITVLVIIVATILISDVSSNTATAAVSIPIIISVINGMGKNPVPYIYVAMIGVNLSYLFPTSIRAIPVGYGLSTKYLFKHGIALTVIVIATMSVTAFIMLDTWFR